jgi:DNA-binding response OmpR family regulator
MARILIINSDKAEALAYALKNHQHSVDIFIWSEASRKNLTKIIGDFDIVILYLNLDSSNELNVFKEIRKCCGFEIFPTILCVARVYRGPWLRLEIERKGGRVIYDR